MSRETPWAKAINGANPSMSNPCQMAEIHSFWVPQVRPPLKILQYLVFKDPYLALPRGINTGVWRPCGTTMCQWSFSLSTEKASKKYVWRISHYIAIAGGFSKDIFTNPNMALLKTIQTLYAGEISPLVRWFSQMFFTSIYRGCPIATFDYWRIVSPLYPMKYACHITLYHHFGWWNPSSCWLISH